MARVVISPPHSANCGRAAGGHVDLVGLQVVERLEQQAEGLAAQRQLPRGFAGGEAVGLQHRHRAADDHHVAAQRRIVRRQELLQAAHRVEDVADHRREQALRISANSS
jgi:hypothetical protein